MLTKTEVDTFCAETEKLSTELAKIFKAHMKTVDAMREKIDYEGIDPNAISKDDTMLFMQVLNHINGDYTFAKNNTCEDIIREVVLIRKMESRAIKK